MAQSAEANMGKNYFDNEPLSDTEFGIFTEILGAREPQVIRRVLIRDAKQKAFIHETPEHLYNPDKPWIVYEPMNRDPKPYVAYGLMKLTLMELGVEKDEEVCLVFSPSSASWMEKYVELIRAAGYSNLTVIRATKDEKVASEMVHVQQLVVSSYTGGVEGTGRLRDNEADSFKRVYLEDPDRMNGKLVVNLDDVWAEFGTGEDMTDGIYEKYSPKRVDQAAVLSKARIQSSHRAKDRQRGIECPRSGIDRARDCIKRKNPDGSYRNGNLVVALDVVGIKKADEGYEIIFQGEDELLHAV